MDEVVSQVFLLVEGRIRGVRLKRQAHCVYRCEFHLVWITKFRYKVFVDGVAEYLEIKLDEVRKYYPEIEYIERSIQSDHVHLLVSFPPKYSVAKVVGILKQNTGSDLMKKFDFLRQTYRDLRSIWSSGYFAVTVGADEKIIKKYIMYQEQEDLGQALLELT